MNEHRDRALTEHDVADRLCLSVATLRAWRTKSKGPRFVRLGRAIRYLESDIDRFVDECAVEAGNGEPIRQRFERSTP